MVPEPPAGRRVQRTEQLIAIRTRQRVQLGGEGVLDLRSQISIEARYPGRQRLRSPGFQEADESGGLNREDQFALRHQVADPILEGLQGIDRPQHGDDRLVLRLGRGQTEIVEVTKVHEHAPLGHLRPGGQALGGRHLPVANTVQQRLDDHRSHASRITHPSPSRHSLASRHSLVCPLGHS